MNAVLIFFLICTLAIALFSGIVLLCLRLLGIILSDLKRNLEIKIKPPQKAEDQFNLGCQYHEGIDIGKDQQKAIYWFRKAAEQDYVDAQYMLGLMYCGTPENDEIEQDYEQAHYWLEKAANQGHSDAQTALGALYYEGHGVEQDYKKAQCLFKQAAEQNNAAALAALGIMYFEGRGVKQSNKQARAFFRQAEQLGFCGTSEIFDEFEMRRMLGKR